MKLFASFLIFSLVLISPGKTQVFEGKIIYKNKITSLTENVSSQKWEEMMGTTMEYAIKNGNYKSSTDGEFIQWQLYTKKDNKLYSKFSNSQSVYFNMGTDNKDKVYKAEVRKGAKEVLGYKCDELVLTCETGTQKFYYHPVLAVNPEDFKNHKYANWDEFLTRAKALPLMMVIEQKGKFVIETTAVKVIPQKLNDSMFQLPAGSKVEKSPY